MIEIEGLLFGYKGKEKLFTNLSLNLPSGNIYGLLGKNGAGKTTLLKILCGLLFPRCGKCQIFGFNPNERLPQFLEDIYFIPEEFQVPSLYIEKYKQLYIPFYKNFDIDQFSEYLREFDISTKQKLTRLSYGEKKKFLISFGLATNSKILILDEPTNGLDIPSKSKFRKLLATSINKKRSFIISTHQVRDMAQLIDPIIILDNGEIIFHEYLETISKNLIFEIKNIIEDSDPVIYSERVLGGYYIISKNIAGENTNINLEILFNAVIKNKKMMKEMFN